MKGKLQNSILIYIPILSLLSVAFCDQESSFSQGCYSACPKKTWNLENTNRQEVNKQWMECLKDCHQVSQWKSIAIFASFVLLFIVISIVFCLCWGQKVRLRYIFHVQRNKRRPISHVDQAKTVQFEQNVTKLKQYLNHQNQQIVIQFENDRNRRKKYVITNAVFQQRKSSTLQNLFWIEIVTKGNKTIDSTFNQAHKIQQNSSDQLKLETQQNSELIGAISSTSKGLNIWWIKVDQKKIDQNQRCKKFCSRRNQKYLAVYQKDPYALEGTFSGNVVLEDSSKDPQERYAKYFITKQPLSDSKGSQLHEIST